MNNPRDSTNPYRADYAEPAGITTTTTLAGAPTSRSPSMPGFAKVVLIVGIVFAALRTLTVPLSIIGWLAMRSAPNADSLLPTVPFEIITSAGVALFGFATCILLLTRRKIGIPLSYILAVFVVGSLFVSAWQGFHTVQKFPPGSQESYGVIGAIVVIGLLRIAWLITFFIGVVQCKKWLEAGNAV